MWELTNLQEPTIIKEAFKYIYRLRSTALDKQQFLQKAVYFEKRSDKNKKSYEAYRLFYEAYEARSLVQMYHAW